MSAKSTTTAVEIFGAVYHLREDNGRGDDKGESLRDLAGTVDRKMREIASQVATVDPAKIAVLAALNLAEELARREKQQAGAQGEVREKVEELTAQLEQALET